MPGKIKKNVKTSTNPFAVQESEEKRKKRREKIFGKKGAEVRTKFLKGANKK